MADSVPGSRFKVHGGEQNAELVSCLVERIYAGLADLPIDSRRRAADADRSNALPVNRDRNTAFDADKPARAYGECLRQHLMIGNLAAVTTDFTRRGCGKCG